MSLSSEWSDQAPATKESAVLDGDVLGLASEYVKRIQRITTGLGASSSISTTGEAAAEPSGSEAMHAPTTPERAAYVRETQGMVGAGIRASAARQSPSRTSE